MQTHYFANKGPSSQGYGFSSSHYGCESWTIKKAEHWRIDAFELWCWRRLLIAPWTARRSNQSILKEISPGFHWKDWCWSWNSNTLATWSGELTHLKRPWGWEVQVQHAGWFKFQFSCSVMSDSLRPHGLQHARLPCPSPTPRVYPKPCTLCWWCHPTISSSVVPFSSCPQSFPASGSFPVSQLFSSGGQSIGVSASTSVLPMNTQDWSL